jgi:secondary thiamine-phosphate synthase enzyme
MLVTFPARQVERSVFQTFHDLICLQTRESLQFIDITEEVRARVAASGIRHGIVNVQSQHTTAAILVNEHEPLLLEDLKRTLERLAPSDVSYRHDDFEVRTVNLTPDEKPNGHAHCKAMFLRSAETINVVNGDLALGTWQRIFFLELDCARKRRISVTAMGR